MNKVGTAYLAEVDYSQSLQTMIKAGKYDWVNQDITEEKFPFVNTGIETAKLQLVHLDRYATNQEVAKEIEEQGFRVAELPWLLFLGARYPDLQRKFPIIALGSSSVLPGGHYCVPCLREYWRGGRHLYLAWYGPSWSKDSRFLVTCT